MKNKKIIATSVLACLVWVLLIFCAVVFADTSSSVTGGEGTWIANLVGYSYSGTVTAYGGSGEVSTKGAKVLASASGNTLTVSATSSTYKAASTCEGSASLA